MSKTETGCWSWTGHLDKDGYGTFSHTSKRLVKAHRYSYSLTNGSIKKGLCVLHRCDNPSCVNPDHLFLGTPADNAADRDAKGRTALGEKSGRTPLSKPDVLEIRSLHEKGLSEKSIAKIFNLSQTGVSGIIRKSTWKHI